MLHCFSSAQMPGRTRQLNARMAFILPMLHCTPCLNNGTLFRNQAAQLPLLYSRSEEQGCYLLVLSVSVHFARI